MATGYAGIVMSPNGPMPVDAYLSTLRKQKNKEREKQRRGKNNYGFDNPEDEPYHKHKSGGYSNHSGGYSNHSGGYSNHSGGYSNHSGSTSSGRSDNNGYSRPRTDKYGHYGSEDRGGGYSNSSSGKSNNIRQKRSRNSNFDSDDDDTTSSNEQVYSRARRRDPFADEAPPTRQKVQYNDYSDDDGYNGNSAGYNQGGGNFKADPFAAAGGPRANKRRGDPFGGQGNNFNDDNDNYQQPQRFNQQMGNSNQGGFPRAKKDLFGGQQDDDFDLFGGGSQQQQQMPRGDPFGGQQQQMPRGDPFGGQQQMPRGDPFGGQQQQMPRGDPFGGQRQQSGFPQAKRNDPFSKRGFNDDDDDDEPGFPRKQQRSPFQQPQQGFAQQQVFPQQQGFPQQQQFQNQQQFQQEEQFFNQAPPQNADDLLFGSGGFAAQPAAQSNANDDFLSLDITSQQSKQQKPDPLAEYGDLVDLNFNKKTREHGKALGSLGSMGSLGAKGGYPRPPPVQQTQPFGNF